MLIIELKDGTQVEVPRVRRIRREDGELRCIDELGRTLETLEAEAVVNYTIAPDPKSDVIAIDETASGG